MGPCYGERKDVSLGNSSEIQMVLRGRVTSLVIYRLSDKEDEMDPYYFCF